MLNELYRMQLGLESIGELASLKHNDIKSPGMGTTFRVILKSDGNVDRIELMTKDKIKNTWSIGNGNKNQFPAVKLTFPLVLDRHEEYLKWKENNKNPKVTAYREFISKHTQLNKDDLKLSGIKCWPSYRKNILEKTEEFEKNYNDENFFQIFERYRKAENDGIAILHQVYEAIREKLGSLNDKELSAACDVLFGAELDKQGNVKDSKRVTLLLDALPSEYIDHYASSRREVDSLSEALFALEERDREESVCSLTGVKSEIVANVFPEEKLSVVGKTILYARNSGTSGPTVKRYDRSGARSYPVSQELSTKLAATIALLSSDKYMGITWSKVPSSVGNSPSLLLAYCTDDLSLSVSKLLAGSSEIENFEDYQDATKTVLDLFHASNCTPDAAVEIAEIIVLDKANRKINYSTTSNIGTLVKSANEWVDACNNTPPVKLYAHVGKDKKFFSPWPVEPVKICYFSRQKYIRNGDSSTSIPAISFSDVMRLFFSENDDSPKLASRILNKLTNQFEPLIAHCALRKVCSALENSDRQNNRLKSNPKNNTQALNTVTLISVLLYKLGRRKEVYMNDFAYQLGQLCSAVDELHIGYCKSMRGGDIPNALIGNLTYGMALQSPIKALAVLATRIKPYETWGKKAYENKSWNIKKDGKVVEDKAIKNGAYANKWLSDQSERIHLHFKNNNGSITDSFKAELMLGYLAGRPFEGRKNQTNSNEPN